MMHPGMSVIPRVAQALAVVACAAVTASAQSRNVVLIVTDGLRWQEVFTGADSTLMNRSHGGIWEDSATLWRRYWRADVAERRKALFPFLWGTIATHGQLFGNQTKGSVVHVTNGYAFSYPGYNEMTTGAGDPAIDNNSYGPNPNVNVFEFLDHQAGWHGKVAIWGTWATFKDIFNAGRSHLPMQVGWDDPYAHPATAREQVMNQLYRTTTRLSPNAAYDSFMQIPLLDFVRRAHPKALFVGYGETDNWGHAGRYDLLLESAHAFDAYVAELWALMQQMPGYKDHTTFIITTDHGRGVGLEDWKDHGREQPGSENVWMPRSGPTRHP
jgi:hypothetical protein